MSPELAGTAAVLASMASAFVNLPLVAKHLQRSTLLVRLAVATTVQTVIVIVVLGAQHFAPAFLRFGH